MKNSRLPSLIGVIHLPPLAGSPGAAGLHPADALQQAGLWAVKEAKILADAGFEGLILENFGDVPFYKAALPPETIASMAVIAAAVRESTRLPIGVNLLRNDAQAALAVAAVTSCQFIRVNVLSGVAATDQGLIEGDAAGLLRERQRLSAEDIAIFADVHVKHARSLSSEDVGLAVEEVALRAGASAVIVTGATTGRAVDPNVLKLASRASREIGVPLYLGSGTSPALLPDLRPFVQGAIVGSTLRRAGKAGAALDLKRVRDFARAWNSRRKKPIRLKKR